MTNQITAILANPAFLQQLNLRLPAIISLLLVIAIDQAQAVRQVASAHLFGEMQSRAVTRQKTAPKTRLNLVLRGVIAADPMALSHAIIARGKNGKEDVFAVGDKMPGGVTIEEVHADHVILNRGGKLETLQLVKDEDVGTVSRSVSKRAGFLPPASPGEALANIRQEILQNPTSFGNYAVPVVVKKNGKQLGYRLQPQQQGNQLMQEVGLEVLRHADP